MNKNILVIKDTLAVDFDRVIGIGKCAAPELSSALHRDTYLVKFVMEPPLFDISYVAETVEEQSEVFNIAVDFWQQMPGEE